MSVLRFLQVRPASDEDVWLLKELLFWLRNLVTASQDQPWYDELVEFLVREAGQEQSACVLFLCGMSRGLSAGQLPSASHW